MILDIYPLKSTTPALGVGLQQAGVVPVLDDALFTFLLVRFGKSDENHLMQYHSLDIYHRDLIGQPPPVKTKVRQC